MQKSKIEWCDYTFNPVTGCLHGCPYCYARKIAHRFGQEENEKGKIHSIQKRWPNNFDDYPFGFDPTFYYYRLDEPQGKKKPQNVFVCSMADLFGSWIPDHWIQQVFEACEKAPQHRYLFLTKNPKGIWRNGVPILKRAWYGITVTRQNELLCITDLELIGRRFISIEPILEPIDLRVCISRSVPPFTDWVIVGSETGTRKDKVIPKREWVENIVNECRKQNVPVFMKNNLKEIWGESLIQEYPWKEEP